MVRTACPVVMSPQSCAPKITLRACVCVCVSGRVSRVLPACKCIACIPTRRQPEEVMINPSHFARARSRSDKWDFDVSSTPARHSARMAAGPEGERECDPFQPAVTDCDRSCPPVFFVHGELGTDDNYSRMPDRNKQYACHRRCIFTQQIAVATIAMYNVYR